MHASHYISRYYGYVLFSEKPKTKTINNFRSIKFIENKQYFDNYLYQDSELYFQRNKNNLNSAIKLYNNKNMTNTGNNRTFSTCNEEILKY